MKETMNGSARAALQPNCALLRIQKRDGRWVSFESDKISRALTAAGKASGEFDDDVARKLTVRVLTVAHSYFLHNAPCVEEIQNIVEEVLLWSPYKKAAKAYILYRDQHAKMREMTAAADHALVDTYLDRADWRIKENANMAFSLQGLNNFAASEITQSYWLHKIYPTQIRDAHISGDLHIHDLNLLSVYCVGWDLKDLLMSGFRGAPGKAESRPPSHFQSALGQIVNFFYTLQGEAAGAQAFSNFDTLLAPFVRQDGLTFEEVKRAVRGFVFNLNVPTRVGFQTPFTNLTLDLKVPSTLAEEPVIIGGALQTECYADYQKEMNLINRALFEVLAEGDAKGRVFTFPIPTVNIGKDFDWSAPELDALWQAAGRYGIPYFANFVNADLSPEDARSMCCRLRLDLRKLEHRGGGLFGANPLTGSIGVVTVNMPRIGFESTNEDTFLARLTAIMDTAVQCLEIKRKALERLSDNRLYPYSAFYLREVKTRFGEYWHNHFSTIGLVGMDEACRNLLGCGVGSAAGRAFSLKVLDFMRDRLAGYQAETGHYYNLEATPAEGAGYRLARLDAARSKGAAFAGNKDTLPCYTNSTQLPVDFTDDVFSAMDLQDEIQSKYTGGTVFHVFTGEACTDIEALKAFVRLVCETYHMPYFTVTPTFSVCPTHGYKSGRQDVCPVCGAACEVYSRVVGYLRPVSEWNEGKTVEFERRAQFSPTV